MKKKRREINCERKEEKLKKEETVYAEKRETVSRDRRKRERQKSFLINRSKMDVTIQNQFILSLE